MELWKNEDQGKINCFKNFNYFDYIKAVENYQAVFENQPEYYFGQFQEQ